MCVPFIGIPAMVPGSEQFERPPALLLYKVVELIGGEHRSSQKLIYPLGEFVRDSAALRGDHERCIHLVPDEPSAAANHMNSYGSHILAVVAPLGHVWTSLGEASVDAPACWHADGCLPVWCTTCQRGIAPPEVVSVPDVPPLVVARIAGAWRDPASRARHALSGQRFNRHQRAVHTQLFR